MKYAAKIFWAVFFGTSVLYAVLTLPAGKPNHVEVRSDNGNYHLYVNGNPFYVQGAGAGLAFGKKGENYLKLAKDMGANTVRTWGTDQGTKRYLDEAHRLGLFVNAGVWFNYVDADNKGISYLHNPGYLKEKEKETLHYVRRFKNHPSVLMWNLGNEVLVHTKNEEEKIAFCRFLESLIQKVKKIDPHHPIVYAAAGTSQLPYLKKYVPSLDIIGINDYGSVIMAQSGWERQNFGKPYLMTEFGPLGPWDRPKDANGRVEEWNDYAKAASYRNYWNLIRERKGRNVGGFAFHLGETTQETLTYWNINDGMHPKEPFVILRKLYLGLKDVNHAPRITAFEAPLSGQPGETITATVAASDPEGETLTYVFEASQTQEGVLQYYVNQAFAWDIRAEGPQASIRLPGEPGIYRIYAKARDASGNSAAASRTVRVEG